MRLVKKLNEIVIARDLKKELSDFCETNNEPDWLKNYREKNLRVFLEKPLKKSLYFKASELNQLLENSANFSEKVFGLDIENNSGKLRVLDWKNALLEFPDLIKIALEKECNAIDQFEAFANAFFNSGKIIIVEENSVLKKPVEVFLNLKEESIVKNVIIVGENSNCAFVEKLDSNAKKCFFSQTMLARERSNAKNFGIIDFSNETIGFVSQQSVLEKDARVFNGNAWLNAKKIRARNWNRLIGEKSSAEQSDVALLNREQFFDINFCAIHNAENSFSNTVFKAGLMENSKSVFNGMIKILPNAKKSNALLRCNSLLLSQNTSSNNIPCMEIETDDVKAAHSATVSQVDEEQLFYLESRGISRIAAQKLIAIGFLETIALKFPESIQSMVLNGLEKKFQANDEKILQKK